MAQLEGSATEKHQLSIPAEPIGDALSQLAQQTGLQVITPSKLIEGIVSTEISGTFSTDEALRKLLANTGLQFRFVNPHTVAISSGPAAAPQPQGPDSRGKDNAQSGAGKGADRPDHSNTSSKDSKVNTGEVQMKHRFAWLLAALGVHSWAPSALAQGEGPAGAAELTQGAQTQLEEVVITAEKREENLQKTPIAVTAVTGETLQALGVNSAIDLTQVVPNLAVSQYGNGANVAIRGVANVNQQENGDPAVAYSIDGVYMARQRAALTGMYDVNRIEVLRGPQGTLYGRNATAGSVNVITNKPDLTASSASGSVDFGNYNAFAGFGMFNMPLSDTLAIRAALNYVRHDGYVDTSPNIRRFDDQDSMAARVHLLWRPIDNFSALFTYDADHEGGAGRAGASSGAPWGLYLSSQGESPYRYATMVGPTYLDQKVDSETLTLNWSLPLFDVTYVGNHRRDDYVELDSQGIYGPLSTYCKDQTSLNCFHPLTNADFESQISHELRLSKNGEQLKWVIGLYDFREYNHAISAYEPNNVGNGTQVRLTDRPDGFEGSKAVFGQATWSPTSSLDLVGGLRYTKDEKSEDLYTYLGPYDVIQNLRCVGCPVTSVFPGAGSWSKTTWHVGADLNLSDDSMLFASVATGYKMGGFNLAAPPANTVFGPENLTNYELGWKNQLLDHRLQVNVAAFLTDYKNYQASAGTQVNGVNFQLVVNAGTAQLKGVELESTFLLTPYDRVTFNATELEAKFTDFFLPVGDGFSPGANFTPYSLTGKELAYAPHTTLRLGYQHTFPLPNGTSLIARADSSYVSHQWMDYHDFAAIAQDAYTRTGASLTWERNKNFSAQLYMHNIENKAILGGVQADTAAPGRDFNDFGKEAYFMPPRTYGIKFTASL
jgi:iron complex outermembrane receptor protein